MTLNSASSLLGESKALITPGDLEMDLSGVTEVDSAAISLLFEWLRHAHALGTSLVFINLPPNLTSLATLYDALDLIPQHTH